MRKIVAKIFRKNKVSHSALLYGLQRSGTNYLQVLIEKNYPQIAFMNSEVRNNPAHKHFRLYDDKTCIPEPQFMNSVLVNDLKEFETHLSAIPDIYLVVSKDPYSWYLSYKKWAKKNNWPPPAYHYMQEWNLFYGKWLEFAGETGKIIFVRYFDLLTNPEKEISEIIQKLNLPGVKTIKTSRKVYASRRFTAGDAKYYTNKEYMQKFSSEEIKDLNARVDISVLQKLGYDLI
ncbi:MAG: hypothetical protein ACKVPJ_08765 [Chitinophagales bacterium]